MEQLIFKQSSMLQCIYQNNDYCLPVLIQHMNSNVSLFYLNKMKSVLSAKGCLQIIAFFNTTTYCNNIENDNAFLRIAITIKTLAL